MAGEYDASVWDYLVDGGLMPNINEKNKAAADEAVTRFARSAIVLSGARRERLEKVQNALLESTGAKVG